MADKAADIKSGRLGKDQLDRNFSDLHAPLSRPEALIEADRCYFCYDAPCTTACPTGIDIPGFIQKIRSDNVEGSAHTILRENIMGGMCARVCPTEVLCEEACVRNTHEDKPVEIGLLQRYATDPVLDAGKQLFERASASGKTVAVVGASPADLSCAHRLAMAGHDVVIFERDTKAGGLNEYGIAAYKTIDNFAQREVEIIDDLTDGLSRFLDGKHMRSANELVGKAVPSVTDWQYLNLNYVEKAVIDQDLCIQCGRCHVVCEDTSHQAITHTVNGRRRFEVIDEECVGCNLCVSVCPVDGCITMQRLESGVDPRTGEAVDPVPRNWTAHPNNPMRKEG